MVDLGSVDRLFLVVDKKKGVKMSATDDFPWINRVWGAARSCAPLHEFFEKQPPFSVTALLAVAVADQCSGCCLATQPQGAISSQVQQCLGGFVRII